MNKKKPILVHTHQGSGEMERFITVLLDTFASKLEAYL